MASVLERVKNVGAIRFVTGTSESGNAVYATTNVNNIVPQEMDETDYDNLLVIFTKLASFRDNTASDYYLNTTDKVVDSVGEGDVVKNRVKLGGVR